MTDYDSRPATGGRPRWVTLAGLIAAILILLVLSMMLLGGGQGIHVPKTH
jgi:hypothetical protein